MRCFGRNVPASLPSLPSRGAWIEILLYDTTNKAAVVAPLTGSVDRNLSNGLSSLYWLPSLPSRGAWIEMARHIERWKIGSGRSPHGERG